MGILILGAYLYQANSSENYLDKSSQNKPTEVQIQQERTLRILSGEEFKEVYNKFHYINTNKILESPVITGNKTADAKIRAQAQERGYILRRIARDTTGVADGQPIQKLAEKYWLELKSAAAKDGIVLTVTSGYRSVDDQRDVFLGGLSAYGISAQNIVDESADGALDEVLKTYAPPGYSRHHTGFTIDLTCGTNGLTNFAKTVCFEWLSRDNYLNAKTFGWAPSYPEGAGSQGPDPEPWEYVWVTISALAE